MTFSLHQGGVVMKKSDNTHTHTHNHQHTLLSQKT